MVRLRLTRAGRRNQPYWRLGAFDARTRRDGKPIEYLGSYDPHQDDPEDKVQFDRERVQYWLENGAQPTDTVGDLLRKLGFEV